MRRRLRRQRYDVEVVESCCTDTNLLLYRATLLFTYPDPGRRLVFGAAALLAAAAQFAAMWAAATSRHGLAW
jgi:hypothetical protein